MDLLTHVLFGKLTHKIIDRKRKISSAALLTATVIPDIGEIFIQKALSEKFNEKFAVYDSRTSDVLIANDLWVTWYYDLFHSAAFAFFLLALGIYVIKSNILISFSIGLLTHVLLDCATHGKVWALKLFFPCSNERFEIGADSLGNWWDWKPTVKLPLLDFPFPVVCFLIWIILIILIFLHDKKFKSLD